MLKKLFISIPLSRLVLYLTLLSLLPLMLVVYYFVSERHQIQELRDKITQVRVLAVQKEQKQAFNRLIRKQFANADPLYLDQQIEVLSLLKKEKEALDRLFQSKTFTGNEAAENRYHFLTGEGNRLQFSQASVQNAEGIQETMEILSHPVEVDGADIKEMLLRIETKRPRQPQLIVSDFKLVKKKPAQRSEVFELHLKLLKREFLS